MRCPQASSAAVGRILRVIALSMLAVSFDTCDPLAAEAQACRARCTSDELRNVFGCCIAREREADTTIHWFDVNVPTPSEPACAAGDARHCTAIGVALARGTNDAATYLRAAALLRRACAANQPEACASLGVMYRSGLGVVVHDETANVLFEQACTLGSPEACREYAEARRWGRGFAAEDIPGAIPFYVRACTANVAEACRSLVRFYVDGSGVRRDLVAAARHARTYCTVDPRAGCERLAEVLQMAGDFARAIELRRANCASGYGEACNDLGIMFVQGTGTAIDRAAALSMYRTACERDFFPGCFNAANALLAGRGTPADRAAVEMGLRRACSGGLERGCELLARLEEAP